MNLLFGLRLTSTDFGHTNIIKYCNRPFDSTEQMDKEIIKRFNEKVTNDDVTYHLGDFTLKGFKDAKNYILRLNGRHVFIVGSHDYWIEEYFKTAKDNAIEEKAIINPLRTILELGKEGLYFVLCHYPMLSWPRSFHGSLNLFGHEHGKMKGGRNQADVGVDTNNFYPYSLKEIAQKIGEKNNLI